MAERELDPSAFDLDYLKQQVEITNDDLEAQAEQERLQREQELEEERLQAMAESQEAEKERLKSMSLEERGQENLDKLQEKHEKTDKKKFGINENITEFRNAIKKGSLTALDGAVTAPERWADAARGEDIGDPNYKTEFDPFEDVELPMVKTWWGKLVEGVAHYGTYGVATVVGAKALGVAAGPTAITLTSAGLGGALSKNHDDHNLSGEIVKKVPELGIVFGPLATKEKDHPLIKKFKNVVEELGMARIFDVILAKQFGSDGVEEAVKRGDNVAIQTIEKGKDEVQEFIAEKATARPVGMKQLGGETIDVDVIPDNQKTVRDAGGKVVESPGGQVVPQKKFFRGHANKSIADPWQGSPNSTGKPFDIKKQLDQIDNEPSAATGSTDSVMTPLQAERMAKQSGLEESFLGQQVKELIGDYRYQQGLKAAKAANQTMQEYFADSFRRMQEIMGRSNPAQTTEEFWKPILDLLPMQTGGTAVENVKSWAMKEVVAADLVNASLFKQLRDLSIGSREIFKIADVMDTDGPMKTIADRLIVGLTNVKRSRYVWSRMGRQLQAKDLDDLAKDVALKTAEFHQASKNNVEMIMQMVKKSDDDEVLQGLLEAMSMGDKINNWTDLDAFMKSKIHGLGNKGIFLKELNGVIVNSVLSSVKTVQRAITGTANVAFLQPAQRALGALATDATTRKANLAALHAHFEVLPEAFTVFKKRFNSYWSGDVASMKTRFSSYNKGDESWDALRRWADSDRASKGDKFAFALSDIARTMNDTNWLTGSVRAMAAVDDTFQFIMARARAKEKAMRKALDAQAIGELSEITPDVLKNYQDDFYKRLTDADGNIDITKDAFLEGMYREATLTTELTGFGKSLDKLFNEYPAIKPFFLFARTGINGLNLTYKNTPLLGALHKKSFDIMKASADDLTSVRKYGITTAADLANEKALFMGRQAMGTGVTLMGTSFYLSGNLTGNGPQDRTLRQSWIDSGWKPRSIRVPGLGWVSYDLAEPYAIILSTIADIGDNSKLMGPEWAEGYYGKMALALAGSAASKTYLQGLTDLVDLMSMQEGKLGNVGANLFNAVVPLSAARNDFGKIITPYMRELNSGIGDAVRNRNKASEKLTDAPLPIKYDMLNGQPLQDWNPIHRIINAVTPLSIYGDSDTAGRKLLRESNYDIRRSTFSAPGNIDLKKENKIRSMWQKAQGETEIYIGSRKFKNPEEALNYLATRPDVQESMEDMRRDLRNGKRHYNPTTTYVHNDLIKNVMNQAKNGGWAKIMTDPYVQTVIDKQSGIKKEQRDRKTDQIGGVPEIQQVILPTR
jgi:hypothetical protein|tara:strand:+ start:3131 stop:7045 length:3915 start_codon:yes stop_codon:yes gene_type:complete